MLTISDVSQVASAITSQIKSSVGALATTSFNTFESCSKAISWERFTQSVSGSIQNIKTSSYSIIGTLAPLLKSRHTYGYLTIIGVASVALGYFHRKTRSYQNDIASIAATIGAIRGELANRAPVETPEVDTQTEAPVEAQSLDTQILELKRDKERLEADLEEKKDDLAAVESNYSEQRLASLRLQGALDSKDSEIESLQQQINDSQAQHTSGIKKLQDSIAVLKEEVNALTQEKESINLERNAYKLVSSSQRERISSLEAQIAELTAEREELQRRFNANKATLDELEKSQSSKNPVEPTSQEAPVGSLTASGFEFFLSSTEKLSLSENFKRYNSDNQHDLIIEDISRGLNKDANSFFPELAEWLEGQLQDVSTETMQDILKLIEKKHSSCLDTHQNSQLAYLEVLLRIRLATTLEEILEVIKSSAVRPTPWMIRKAFVEDLNTKDESYWNHQINLDIHRLKSEVFTINRENVSNLLLYKGIASLTEANGLTTMTELLKGHVGETPLNRLKFLAQDIRNKMMEYIKLILTREGLYLLSRIDNEEHTFVEITTKDQLTITIDKNFYLVSEGDLEKKNTYDAKIQAKVRIQFENEVPNVEWSWQVL